MLGHHVCQILRAQDFREVNNAVELLLLESQHADVEVTKPANALALENPWGGRGICV